MTSLTGRSFEYFTDEFMNMLMRCFWTFLQWWPVHWTTGVSAETFFVEKWKICGRGTTQSDENVVKFVDAVAAVYGASGCDGSDAGVQRGRYGGAGICVSARLHLQKCRIGRLPRCRHPKHQPSPASSVRHQIVSLWFIFIRKLSVWWTFKVAYLALSNVLSTWRCWWTVLYWIWALYLT